MNLSEVSGKGKDLVVENSTTILTAIGVTGSITTAVLTGRASIKAAELIRVEDEKLWVDSEDDLTLTTREKLLLVWPLYIPPVGVGSVTITSIIMANRLSSKKAAAMAALYSVSEQALAEYKTKIVEKLGEGKATKIRDEVAQDRVKNNPPGTKEIILAGTGEVLCYDMFTGRYFQSTVEEIKKAENTVNHEIVHHMSASLSSFYDEIGLPPTGFTDSIGWNTNNLCEVQFSSVLQDDKPCLAVDFAIPPVADYGQLY